MICPWFVDIEYWYKNDPYIIIYEISQIVYFKFSILTNHGHIINFTWLFTFDIHYITYMYKKEDRKKHYFLTPQYYIATSLYISVNN